MWKNEYDGWLLKNKESIKILWICKIKLEYLPKIVRIFRIYISFSVVYMETGKYDDRLDKYVIQKEATNIPKYVFMLRI